MVAQMLRDSSQPLPRWNLARAGRRRRHHALHLYRRLSFNSNCRHRPNIDIPSGFDAAGNVTGTRASAPFAILDTIYQGMQTGARCRAHHEFSRRWCVDWGTTDPGGNVLLDSGAQHIVLLADVTEDTDEFDQHVIAHEFGHYIEYNFSRADNIGGSHGLGDKLDRAWPSAKASATPLAPSCSTIRWRATASSTTATQRVRHFQHRDQPADQSGGHASGNFGCWCSESSVWSILWDLYDSAADAQRHAGARLPAALERADQRAAHHAGVHHHLQLSSPRSRPRSPATPPRSTPWSRRRTSTPPSSTPSRTGETHLPTPVVRRGGAAAVHHASRSVVPRWCCAT